MAITVMGPITYFLFCLLFFGGLFLLGLYLRTFVKTTVDESIAHQFDLKLEKFKQDFEKDLHTLDRKDKYQLAALDERLKVHQQAFRITWSLLESIHDEGDTRGEALRKLYDFWLDHSLYLTNDARKAYFQGLEYFRTYGLLLKVWHSNHDPKTEKELNEKFDYISKLPEIIAKSIDIEAMASAPMTKDGEKVTAFGIEKNKEEKE